MRNLLRKPLVLALVVAMACGAGVARLAAQGAGPETGTAQATAALAAKAGIVEVGGLKLGMPMKDAQAALAKSMMGTPKVLTTAVVPPFTDAKDAPAGSEQVTATAADSKGNKEKIEFIWAQPPNAPVVRWIKRKVDYSPGSGPNFDTVLAGLRKTYGPESVVLAQASGERVNTILMRWMYDPSGQQVKGDVATKEWDCKENAGGTPLCRNLTILEIYLQADAVKVTYGLTQELESYPLSRSAREATQAAAK